MRIKLPKVNFQLNSLFEHKSTFTIIYFFCTQCVYKVFHIFFSYFLLIFQFDPNWSFIFRFFFLSHTIYLFLFLCCSTISQMLFNSHISVETYIRWMSFGVCGYFSWLTELFQYQTTCTIKLNSKLKKNHTRIH